MMKNKLLAILAITAILCSIALTSQTQQVKAQSYSYTFAGPIIDGTALYSNDAINLTVTTTSGYVYSHILKTSGDTIWTFTTAQLASAKWNASSALNGTRIIDFLPTETSGTYTIHVSDTSVPTTYYLFTVTDFSGMTHPYIAFYYSNGSTNALMERHNLLTSNAVPFFLQQFTLYSIQISCDQGSYSIPYRTGAIFTENLQVLAGSFGSTTLANSNATATRVNATAIYYSYYNPNSTTTWTYFSISHYNGATSVIDYTHNETSTPNSYSGTLTVTQSTAEYFVEVIANEAGTNKTWIIPCPAPTTSTNPFTALMNLLGTYPDGFDPGQIIALILISLFIAVGSFRSTGASCIFAAIAAGFFILMGWYILSPWFIGLAIFLGVLTYIGERKEEQMR